MRALRFAAGIAVRRHQVPTKAPEVVQRLQHEVAIALARRRAAMTRATLPGIGADEAWVLSGKPLDPENTPEGGRLPGIEEDADIPDNDFGDCDWQSEEEGEEEQSDFMSEGAPSEEQSDFMSEGAPSEGNPEG